MTTQRIQLGQSGEEEATAFLKRQGYKILQRNFRSKLGEIDIIAKDGATLCFVEVRTRTSEWHGHPFESITPRKKQKLIKTALTYLKLNGLTDTDARFDVVAVIPQEQGGFDIEIIKNAFDGNGF